MSEGLLSEEEMFSITGAKHSDKQIRVLQDNNIPHIVRHDGKPVTTWYNVNNPAHLRGISTQSDEPDFSSLQIKH